MNPGGSDFNKEISPEKLTEPLDIYGFILKQKKEYEQKKTEERESDDKTKGKIIKRDNARLEKWRIYMLPKLDKLIKKKSRKLKRRVRKGVPDCLRGKVWPKLAWVEDLKAKKGFKYEDLVAEKNVPYESEIKLDVNRTFPNHIFFKEKDDVGQNSLLQILKCLSLVFTDMGYCQGLNFIAATFILYCNDEECFWMMTNLMEKYSLLELYQNLERVNKPLEVLDNLIQKYMPKLHAHMAKIQVQMMLFAPGWFITLYSSILPFQLVLRIMDMFFAEGNKILYRAGLAILKIKEEVLLSKKSDDSFYMELRNFKNEEFQDDDSFIKTCLSFKFSKKTTQKMEKKFETEHPLEGNKNKPGRIND